MTQKKIKVSAFNRSGEFVKILDATKQDLQQLKEEKLFVIKISELDKIRKNPKEKEQQVESFLDKIGNFAERVDKNIKEDFGDSDFGFGLEDSKNSKSDNLFGGFI